MAEDAIRKRGRPAGVTRPLKKHTYLNQHEADLLASLAQRRGISQAGLLRQLVLEEAERAAGQRPRGVAGPAPKPPREE